MLRPARERCLDIVAAKRKDREHAVVASAGAKGMMTVQLVDGRYKCNWCGSDLDVPYLTRDTIEIISQHDGADLRIIVVDGDEHHRCQRPTAT